MNIPKTVSVTNKQVTTTQSDSLRTNLTDNMQLTQMLSLQIFPNLLKLIMHTINTRNDTQTEIHIQ